AELEQVNAELDSFAYSVSHDLKSPLRAIDGFTQLLKDQLQDRASADERAMMERVLAATHRMSDLIADMLSLARISQGMLEMVEVDLSDLVQDIRRRTQTRMPERAIEWRIQPDLLCRCDASLARIALDNLLSNALKYTRDQPHPLIEFGQMPGTSGGPGEYFVRDNGVGFDMRHADKLFKPFQRLHMPSEGFEGSGIGLATVHRIVERHAGRIRADSRVGEGTSLYFSFEANQP
ncbi:ATP-binding protein, partial [Hydrogenophaga sp.]|uniref:sensor histidine kinase n=1 Tax=Hydrogenophaga sp. TaxID=1904254 RepID=UPI0035663FE1